MFAVKFHKFAFYKLCRVVVPGNTDCLSSGADRFKDKVNDFVQPVPVNHILGQPLNVFGSFAGISRFQPGTFLA